MTNLEQIAKIKQMDDEELLDFLIAYPECMTDSYYREFRTAILKRYEEIVKTRTTQWTK